MSYCSCSAVCTSAKWSLYQMTWVHAPTKLNFANEFAMSSFEPTFAYKIAIISSTSLLMQHVQRTTKVKYTRFYLGISGLGRWKSGSLSQIVAKTLYTLVCRSCVCRSCLRLLQGVYCAHDKRTFNYTTHRCCRCRSAAVGQYSGIARFGPRAPNKRVCVSGTNFLFLFASLLIHKR